MNDLFSEIKNALEMVEVASFYYSPPNRSGFVCCPFHAERTPSCKLYQRRFKCFACGASGDVVDFVGRLLNLAPLDAAKRINEDFRLGLRLDRAPPDPDRRRARQLFEEWKLQTLNLFDACIRTANLADYGTLTDAEALALVYKEPLEHWAGILMHGALAEQMSVFDDREEVQRLCQKILTHTSTKFSAA